MQQIKNVINYDEKALNQAILENMERFHNDELFLRLSKRNVWISRIPDIVSSLGLICVFSGLLMIPSGKLNVLSLVMLLIGLGLSLLSYFRLRTFFIKIIFKNTRKMREILEKYTNTPAMKYHSFVSSFGAEDMEIWGAEIGNSKFEVTLSKKVNGELKQGVMLFNYSERDPEGSLTLDVGNETVYRMSDSDAM